MSGVEDRELVPRELDEPYGYEPGLAVFACINEAAHKAQQVGETRQIDWLIPEAADEKEFLEHWVAELGRLDEDEKKEEEEHE